MSSACKTGNAASKTYEEDRRLVEQCTEGHEDAWRRFLEHYGTTIRLTAQAVVQQVRLPSYEIDEITSFVYEKLVESGYHRLQAWRGQSSLRTYLTLVVRNLSLDYVRRHHKGRRVDDHSDIGKWLEGLPDQPPPEAFDKDQMDALRAAIEALPTRQALIMRLRLEGRPLRSIAKLLDAPQGTVFAESTRAIEKLRKALVRAQED